MEQIAVKHLTFTYPNAAQPALFDVSLSLAPGSFSVLCGPSGCGKSTFLRQLKPSLTPNGKQSGSILYHGRPLSALTEAEAAGEIAFILQNPERQMVTNKVWHELAFGLESLGIPQEEMHLRIGEIAAYFGMEAWLYQDTDSLSGGQKQLLALASAMALRPRLLLLDEPTAQLDPIHTEHFLAALQKINRELGVTVLLSEHRLDGVLPLCDRLIVMDAGRITADGTPQESLKLLFAAGHPMAFAAPDAAKIAAGLSGTEAALPLSVRDGRAFLADYRQTHPPKPAENIQPEPNTVPPALTAKNLWFRYTKQEEDILRGLSLSVPRGVLYAVMGGTGSGKSTLLSLLSGGRKSVNGRIQTDGRVLLLPQDPACLFLKDTVEKDLLSVCKDRKRLDETAVLCAISHLLNRHPYDLSGGEQQRAALAKLLLCQPDILLLDEPTKGLDAFFKRTLAQIFKKLQHGGVTLLMVSHDVHFCAEYADGCAFLFGGTLTDFENPRDFFIKNTCYTTDARRISAGLLPACVTVRDVLQRFNKTSSKDHTKNKNRPDSSDCANSKDRTDLENHTGDETRTNFPIQPETKSAASKSKAAKKTQAAKAAVSPAEHKKRAGLRLSTLLSLLFLLISVPLILWVGMRYFGDRRYYFISLCILGCALIAFAIDFEGQRPRARELVLLSVMTGIAVLSRSAFYMFPQFKPMTALVIITGISMGSRYGFAVGALAAFVSNFFFGQGPWTPWQMFAYGCIGFVSGLLPVWLRRCQTKGAVLLLSLFGFLATLVFYGGIMNPASILMTQADASVGALLASFLPGLPFDLIHAVSTAVTLLLLARPICSKISRIRDKYGLVLF